MTNLPGGSVTNRISNDVHAVRLSTMFVGSIEFTEKECIWQFIKEYFMDTQLNQNYDSLLKVNCLVIVINIFNSPFSQELPVYPFTQLQTAFVPVSFWHAPPFKQLRVQGFPSASSVNDFELKLWGIEASLKNDINSFSYCCLIVPDRLTLFVASPLISPTVSKSFFIPPASNIQ